MGKVRLELTYKEKEDRQHQSQNAQRVLQDTCGHMHGNGAVLRATFMQLLLAARERDGCYWASAHHDHERCLVTADISVCCALRKSFTLQKKLFRSAPYFCDGAQQPSGMETHLTRAPLTLRRFPSIRRIWTRLGSPGKLLKW